MTLIKSICDNCSAKNCLWRAETESLDPPVMGCKDFKKKMTNADKYFRKATDEKIALFIHNTEAVAFDLSQANIGKKALSVEEWLDWLKQEAKDDG